MTVDDDLRAYLDAAREREEQPADLPDGSHVFPRDDDVVLTTWLAREIDKTNRPCVFSGGFWMYNEDTGAWRPVRRPAIRLSAMSLSGMRVFVKKDGDIVVTKPLKMPAGRVKGIVDLVETSLDKEDYFADAPMGLAFKNGFVTVDKTDGITVKPKSPTHRARASFPFAYREDYECPLWQDFLFQVFRDDDDREQKTAVLQEFLGVALLGGMTTYDKAVILYGEGANGKSVFLDVIQRLFPEESIASIAPQQLDDEYYKARLDGVLLNVVSEMPKNDVVNTPALNGIISGDKIEARRPCESPFEFRPRAAHIFSANPPLPSVTDMARGFWRRWFIISFNRSFEKDAIRRERKDFVDDLAKEARGIVRWALLGAARVKAAGGFTEIPSSEELLSEWRQSADQIAQFVREKLVEVADDVERMLQSQDLYAAYRSWSEATGHRAMTMSKFNDRLTSLGHKPVQDGPMLLRPLTYAPEIARARWARGTAEPEQDSFLD